MILIEYINNVDNIVHQFLLNLIVSRSEETEDTAKFFQDSFDNFYNEHNNNQNNFDLIINSILDSMNEMQAKGHADFDQIKEILDICLESDFDLRLIYACQFFDYENKYEFIISKCMAIKLRNSGIFENFAQASINQI